MIKSGGMEFKTKQSLKNYCKFVLNNAKLNSELYGEWFDVIDDVLKMHDCYDEKTQSSEYKIGVRKCLINPSNRQFYVIRSDGSTTDFSYLKAITSETKEVKIKSIFREAINYQTIEFKKNYFSLHGDSRGYVVCPETNLKIKHNNSHIDHYPKQFNDIVKEFIQIHNISSESLVIHHPGDNATAWIMEDKELLDKFVEYHQRVAQYRIVLDKVNLQRKRPKSYKF